MPGGGPGGASSWQHGNRMREGLVGYVLAPYTAVSRMRVIIGGLAALLVILQFQLWSPESGLPHVWRLNSAVAEQEKENERLRERNAALEADVRDLKDGMEALEERARSELGMIREGETFYQVADQ